MKDEKKYIYRIIAVNIICLSFFSLKAQDLHFSQFYSAPLTFNPASAGAINGDYRVTSAYKQQWQSVGKGYKTSYVSLDMPVYKPKKSNGFLGAGLSFYNDKAGTVNMGLTQVDLSFAYSVGLNKKNDLAAGLQGGFAQRSFDPTLSTWDNQYTGDSYDPSASSGENGLNSSFTYWDFGAGMYWNHYISTQSKFEAGASVYHINQPDFYFYKTGNSNLSMKYVFHADAVFKIKNTNESVVPSMLITKQGPLQEILFGSLIKHVIGNDSKYTGLKTSSTLSLGAFYRLKDAIILSMLYDHKQKISFGISYDINVSGLTYATRGQGGLELTFKYKGFFVKNQPQVKTLPGLKKF